jgi:hypothetical protein
MIFFYVLIIIIVVILIMPHKGQESFVVSKFKEKILAKTDDLSKYMILHN